MKTPEELNQSIGKINVSVTKIQLTEKDRERYPNGMPEHGGFEVEYRPPLPSGCSGYKCKTFAGIEQEINCVIRVLGRDRLSFTYNGLNKEEELTLNTTGIRSHVG
jgi:hypothetical protein